MLGSAHPARLKLKVRPLGPWRRVWEDGHLSLDEARDDGKRASSAIEVEGEVVRPLGEGVGAGAQMSLGGARVDGKQRTRSG